MSKKAIGLSEEGILIAEYKDGAQSQEADYKSLGLAYKDTATLEDSEGEEITCDCEELEYPEEVEDLNVSTVLKYSTSDVVSATCAKIFGGTATEGKWTRPKSLPVKVVSFKFKTKNGRKVSCAKARMRSRFNWKITKSGYALIEHTLTLLSELEIEDPKGN